MADSRPGAAPGDESSVAKPGRASPAWKWTRRVLWVVLCLAGLLWLAHAPFVRGWVLDGVTSGLASRNGLTIEATGLDYNLLTLTASIDDCRIATRDQPSPPLVRLGRVTAVFGSGVLTGRLDVQSLDADDVAIQINAAGGTEPSRPFTVPGFSAGAVRVNRLSIDYVDADGGSRLAIRGGSLNLTGRGARQLDGPFAVESVAFDNETARIATGRVEGFAVIDGDAVVLRPRRAVAGQDAVTFDGEVALTGPEAGYRLGVEGGLSLELLNTWFPGVPGGQGRVRAQARLTGRLAEPRAELRLESDGITWPRFVLPRTVAEGLVSREGMDISRLTLSSGAARLVASGRIGFGSAAASAARLGWTGVTPAVVSRALGETSPGVPPMTSAGSADLTWDGLVPSVTTLGGEAEARLTVTGTPTESGTVRVTASRGRWRVRAEHTLAGGTQARLDADLVADSTDVAASAVSGALSVSTRDARPALAQLKKLGAPVPALPDVIEVLPLEIEARLTGSAGRPQLAGSVSSAGLRVDGAGSLTAQAAFAASLDALTVERLRATDEHGNVLEAGGHLSFAGGETRGSLSIQVVALDPVAQLLPAGWTLGGAFDAEGSWSGTLGEPAADVRVTGREVTINRASPGPLNARVTMSEGTLHVEGDVPALAARVTGSIALLEPRSFEAAATVVDADLATLASALPGSADPAAVTGSATGQATVSGMLGSPDELVTHLHLERLDGRIDGRPIVLDGPADVRLTPFDMAVDGLSLRSGATTLLADGRVDRSETGELVLILDSPAADLARLIMGTGDRPAVTADGHVRVEARASGPAGAIALGGHATVALDAIKVWDRTVAEHVRADIELRNDTITAPRITGVVLGGPLDLAVSVPTAWLTAYLPKALAIPGAQTGSAHLLGGFTVPAGALLRLLQPGRADEASGSVAVSLEATAARPSVEAIDGTATLRAEQMVVGDVPFSLRRPGVLSLRSGRLRFEGLQFRARAADLGLGGYVDLVDPMALDVRLTGSGPLAFLSSVLPGRTSGNFSADLTLSGPTGAPTATGTVTLDKAALVIPAQRIALTDWSGRIDLTPESLTAQDLRGQVNGGDAVIRGRLPLTPGPRDASRLTLSVRDAFVEIVKGFKSQVDGDLELEALDDGLRLGGSVTAISGAYREPVTAMAALFAGAGSTTTGGPADRGALDRVVLDVQVLSRSPLIVENSLGRVDLVPEMRLTGTLAEPALTGSLNALEGGRLTLAGRQYLILESQVLFTPRDGWMPHVNLSGETRIGEYTITLRTSGPADAIETSASSTPPLSDRDLRSLIVTGRTTEVSGPAGANDAEYALEALSSEILGFAGQMVGLDSLQLGRADFDIGSSDVNPATRLTVTKSLNARFRVILSENLDNNRLTWIIVADSGRGYEFRFSQRDNLEEVIEFRHETEFGPGTSRRAAAAPATGPAPKVSSVTFTGTPGVASAELQAVVKTRKGRRFDIEQWQRDRERLETFFRNRGHATARVVPRRTVTDTPAGPRVDVEYDINQGPRTVLEVEGVTLPDSVREELLAAWEQSVLPEFLRDDFIRIVRRHLADAGQLQPGVEFVFDEPSEATQRVTLRVVEGPAVRSKRIVFDGNLAISEDDIRTGAARDTLDEAWIDAGPLVGQLVLLYRERGYFDARATVAPVAFAGGRAELRVRVEEGPRARVSRVVFEGVGQARVASVRAAAALEAGAPFLPGNDREAGRRVHDLYSGLGFRSASVQATHSIETDGGVTVTLNVSEGAQSIVTAVRVEGAQATTAGTIAKAVTLRPGDPAGASSTSETQNRLYGLGMFRSADVRFEPAGAGAGLADGQIPVEAVVSLAETRRFRLRYGLQVSNEHGPLFEDIKSAFGVAADVRDRNFLGRGVTLGGSGRYERDLQTVRGLLFLPRYRNQRLETNFFATWRNERDVLEDFTTTDTRRDVTFEQRWLARRGVELSWSYSYYWREFGLDVARTGESVAFGGTLAGLQTSLLVDRRDSVFDATRGWFHSQNVQFGLRPLGSDVSYIRYLGRQYVYVPVGPLVFASGVRWGTLANIEGTPPLTILDLFFSAGGSQTVRGYSQDSLSALSAFDVPLGGTDLLIVNQEVRFPIFKWFKGAAFIDAGNTFGALSEVSLSGLAVGAGFGLRIQTPLAPFRIDIAFPIGPFRDSRYRWHFSIGQMF